MPKQNREYHRTERAAATLEAERRRARNRQVLTVAGVVAVLALIAGVLFFIQPGDDAAPETSVAPEGASDYALAVGEADAPHLVVVYEDFLCPFCAEFEAASDDDLARLAEEGEARVEYRPLNFLSRMGDYSERATNAFAAVLDQEGPEVAKDFHDALFENQPPESGPFPDDDALIELAVAAGADEAEIRPAVEDLEFEGWVANATEEASRAGVRGTPTIVLDGEQFADGATVEELADNLVAQIEED